MIKIKLLLFYKWHSTWLNLLFHFLTAIVQIVACWEFLKTFNWFMLAVAFAIPWVTDGIGHLCEGNFKEVWEESKRVDSSNALNVNPLENFILKLIALPYAIIYKLRH